MNSKGNSYSTEYAGFDEAISVTNSLKDTVSSTKEKVTSCKSNLNSDTVFAGPICESCAETFSTVDNSISNMLNSLANIGDTLKKISERYKSGDTEAAIAFLSTGGSSGVSSTQASSMFDLGDRANSGDKAAQKEFIEKMAKIVDPYCEQYGFPKSVLLSQIIQESGWDKSSSWLNANNNVLNVNSTMFGSGDYVVAKDGTRNDNASIPRWAKNPKHASGKVSGGAYFEAPRTDSMRAYDSVEDCVEDYLALMVGYRPYLSGSDVDTVIDGIKGYAEDANYSTGLHNIIDTYNLTQYDTKNTPSS